MIRTVYSKLKFVGKLSAEIGLLDEEFDLIHVFKNDGQIPNYRDDYALGREPKNNEEPHEILWGDDKPFYPNGENFATFVGVFNYTPEDWE